MTKIFLTLVYLITTFNMQAQFKQVAAGPLFDEPETGFSKILLLQNHTTVFFNITLKNGITIKIYDAEHKEKTNKVLAPAYGELKAAVVNSIFEMKGDVVIMMSTADGKTPVLYRLIIDGQTGSLKEERKIAELTSMSMAKGYAVIFGNVPVPEFHVRKDPGSDNYGVVLLNLTGINALRQFSLAKIIRKNPGPITHRQTKNINTWSTSIWLLSEIKN